MKKLILILLCLGLTGCVSASNISQNKNSALKNSESERVVENDKKPFYFFTKEKELRYIAENKDDIAFWATNGDSFFQYSLGELYYYGYENTVPINYEKAFYWFNKAFQQGNFLAAFYIGRIYYEGQNDFFAKYTYQRATDYDSRRQAGDKETR
jgi:TPR repeat protein